MTATQGRVEGMSPTWLANMEWLLQNGIGYDSDDALSYLVVLAMMAPAVGAFLDATAGEAETATRQAVVDRAHGLYFAFGDWRHLWHEVGGQVDGLTPILIASRRLDGLITERERTGR